MPLLPGKIITLFIRDLSKTGEGIGSIDGFTLFVDGALPGEEVRARIEVVKKNYATALLLEVLEESKGRQKPICPLFGQCGGCQIMHLVYQEQLKIKEKMVRDAFDRIGKIPSYTLFPCRPSDQETHYRNKLQMPVEEKGGKTIIGFYAKRSHKLIEVEHCYIHEEVGEKVFSQIRERVGKFPKKSPLTYIILRSTTKGEVYLTLVSKKRVSQEMRAFAKELMHIPGVKGVIHGYNPREDNVVRSTQYTHLEGSPTIEEEMLGLSLQVSTQSFFQVNFKQAENIYQKVASWIAPGEKVLDAYCGIGTLTLYLAKRGAQVTGIEIIQEAIEDAKKNALRNHLQGTFLVGKVEEVAQELEEAFSTIIVNPPRKGCEERVLETIAKISPKKVIYISCDPATLARDLAILYKYGYTSLEAHPFDMFPSTMHVETVALLQK